MAQAMAMQSAMFQQAAAGKLCEATNTRAAKRAPSFFVVWLRVGLPEQSAEANIKFASGARGSECLRDKNHVRKPRGCPFIFRAHQLLRAGDMQSQRYVVFCPASLSVVHIPLAGGSCVMQPNCEAAHANVTTHIYSSTHG